MTLWYCFEAEVSDFNDSCSFMSRNGNPGASDGRGCTGERWTSLKQLNVYRFSLEVVMASVIRGVSGCVQVSER